MTLDSIQVSQDKKVVLDYSGQSENGSCCLNQLTDLGTIVEIMELVEKVINDIGTDYCIIEGEVAEL